LQHQRWIPIASATLDTNRTNRGPKEPKNTSHNWSMGFGLCRDCEWIHSNSYRSLTTPFGSSSVSSFTNLTSMYFKGKDIKDNFYWAQAGFNFFKVLIYIT